MLAEEERLGRSLGGGHWGSILKGTILIEALDVGQGAAKAIGWEL